MTDVFSKTKRSAVMSRIRRDGNKDTELALINLFKRHGITGWRRHERLYGNPDFIFRKQRVAVFVDGCFWHGCVKHYSPPKNNKAFWQRKLCANKARDRLVTRSLCSRGWSVLRIWEHELALKNEIKCIRRIQRFMEKMEKAAVKRRQRDQKLSSLN